MGVSLRAQCAVLTVAWLRALMLEPRRVASQSARVHDRIGSLARACPGNTIRPATRRTRTARASPPGISGPLPSARPSSPASSKAVAECRARPAATARGPGSSGLVRAAWRIRSWRFTSRRARSRNSAEWNCATQRRAARILRMQRREARARRPRTAQFLSLSSLMRSPKKATREDSPSNPGPRT